MLLDIIDVKSQDNFILWLKFENGEEKEFDCKSLFDKNIFKPLMEKEFFSKVKILHGTVAWSDEIDISPDTLYLDSKKVNIKCD